MVIPVKNGGEILEECLEALFSQETVHEMEVLAVDSGSTDGSLDTLARYPVRVVSIPPEEFSHGDTRNFGASLTSGDVIVFLVQDAVAQGRGWLDRLVSNLETDDRVGGAFCRVIPRPDCGPLVERGVRGDLNFGDRRIEYAYDRFDAPEGWDPHTRRIRANFNDVASCLRRGVWGRIPLQRTPFGEDIVWADSVQRAGWRIVFDPEAVVIHSHEYRPRSIFPRTHVDAWFNRAFFNRLNIEKLSHVFIQAWRQFREDRRFLKAKGLPVTRRIKESAVSLAYHFLEFLGFWMGGRVTGARIYPVVDAGEGPLTVLLAVSPETVEDPNARTGAAALADALAEGGHRPVWLGAEGAGEGGTTWLGHPIERIPWPDRHGLSSPRAPSGSEARAFGETLDKVKPTVVHCQDFRAFTAEMPALLRDAGIPCLVTVRDLYFACPRGDLTREGGAYCASRNPPGLGCAACLAGHEEYVVPGTVTDRMLNATRAGRIFARASRGILGSGHLTRAARMRALLDRADFLFAHDRHIASRLRAVAPRPDRVVGLGYGPPTAEALRAAETLRREGPAAMAALVDGEAGYPSEGWADQAIMKYRQALSRTLYKLRTGGNAPESKQRIENG